MTFTILVSNHPHAGDAQHDHRADVVGSWKKVYDGPLLSTRDAKRAATALTGWYRVARVFGHGGRRDQTGLIFTAKA